jgi:hypothetical protein
MTGHAWPLTPTMQKLGPKTNWTNKNTLAIRRYRARLSVRDRYQRLLWEGRRGQLRLSLTNTFYEKVVKVKADVAAILKFFLPLRSRRSRLTIWTRPRWHPSGGCARGVSAERFETPLAGGAAASMCASAVCWRAACQRRGGNPPAPAFPRRGKRERGSSDFLAAAGSSRWRGADGRHAAGGAPSTTTLLSITITKPICRSVRSAFQKSGRHHPLLAVLLSALFMGRDEPGASWGPM